MFNREKMAEILQDLRKGKEDDKRKAGIRDYRMSFVKLSKEIEDKIGINISNTALWEYEKENGQKKMSIEFLCALADYYEVSTDYLLGRAGEVKTPNIEIQAINKVLGLSEEAIANIKAITRTPEERDILCEILRAGALFKLVLDINYLMNDYSLMKETKPTLLDKIVEILPNVINNNYNYKLWIANTTAQQLISNIIERYYLKTKNKESD